MNQAGCSTLVKLVLSSMSIFLLTPLKADKHTKKL